MKSIIITLLFIFSVCHFSAAQQLVYRPVNPAFGGDTFNYQWLLNSAQEQNTFTENNNSGINQGSELERFTENLNSQLLSQISRTLFTEQFDEGLTEGTFNFGSLFIEVFPSGEGLVINILDTANGDESQVIIPN